MEKQITADLILGLLFELQQLEFTNRNLTPEQEAQVNELRAKIPAQYLRHYDRLKQRGRKGVSLVVNGVCSECRMRLASGVLNGVRSGNDIYVCDNCARYLYYREAE